MPAGLATCVDSETRMSASGRRLQVAEGRLLAGSGHYRTAAYARPRPTSLAHSEEWKRPLRTCHIASPLPLWRIAAPRRFSDWSQSDSEVFAASGLAQYQANNSPCATPGITHIMPGVSSGMGHNRPAVRGVYLDGRPDTRHLPSLDATRRCRGMAASNDGILPPLPLSPARLMTALLPLANGSFREANHGATPRYSDRRCRSSGRA